MEKCVVEMQLAQNHNFKNYFPTYCRISFAETFLKQVGCKQFRFSLHESNFSKLYRFSINHECTSSPASPSVLNRQKSEMVHGVISQIMQSNPGFRFNSNHGSLGPGYPLGNDFSSDMLSWCI